MIVDEILDRKGRRVHEVSPDWPVSKAAALLAAWNVGTTLVTDFKGGLLGIISERDIIRSLNEFGGNVLRIKIGDLMTRSVITCTPEAEIGEALSSMAYHRIRHLPVVKDNKIQGIISVRDVLRFRIETLEENFSLLMRSEEEAKRLRAEAEAANRTKTQFLAHMSHELRTPLNAIIGFSDVIASGLFDGDTAALNCQYAKHVNTAGRHLLKLVTDVLDLSNMVSGQLDLKESTIELGALVGGCADEFQNKLAERHLGFATSIPDQKLLLMVDDLRLKQVLANVLSNAIKFSRVGGRIELVAAVNGGGDLSIAITDHGIGMRPEHVPISLEPFRHIDSDPTHSSNGTGIGLPLAKLLIEKHGGRLGIKSRFGKGTTVTILVPGWRIDRTTASELLPACPDAEGALAHR